MVSQLCNSIHILSALTERFPEIGVYGDFARGMMTEDVTDYDKAVIVTDRADILIHLPSIARDRNPYSNNPKVKDSETLTLLWSKLCSQNAEETESFEPYLTVEEMKGRVSNKVLSRLFRPEVSANIAYDLAIAVFQYGIYDAAFTIHIVEPGDVTKYMKELSKLTGKVGPNNIYYVDGNFGAIDMMSLSMAESKQAYAQQDPTQETLKFMGWKAVLCQ